MGQLKDILLPFLQTPTWFSSLCISSLKVAARNKSITNLQLAHSEEHHPQVEKLLTCLLTDLSAEERRIRRSRSVLVCPCIEVLPISESDCAMLGLVVMAGVLLQCTVCGISMFEFFLLSSIPFTYVHTALPAVNEWNSWAVLLWACTYSCFLPVLVATSILPSSPGYPAGDTCAGPTSQSMESASQSNQVSTAHLPLVNIYTVSYPARFFKMAIAIQKTISETESTFLVQWRQNHMLQSHNQPTSTLST